MSGRACTSLREALHLTAVGYLDGMKRLAAELDWSPSELSMRTTLGGDSARPFPADDEHFVRLMKVTGDISPLLTACELLGYDPPPPKRDRMPEMVVKLTEAAQGLSKEIQLLLDFGAQQAGEKRGRR